MNMRVFGAHDCDECNKLKSELRSNRVSFQFVDGLADENQDLCDEQGVWNFPHVQIMSDKGAVLKDFDEDTDPSFIINVWLDLTKTERKSSNGRPT